MNLEMALYHYFKTTEQTSSGSCFLLVLPHDGQSCVSRHREQMEDIGFIIFC